MKPKLLHSGILTFLLCVVLLAAAPVGAAVPNPIDDAGTFVSQHYLDFLGRAADSGGLAFWSGQITQCGSDAPCVAQKRVDVARAFFFSTELIDLEQSLDLYGRRRLDANARNTPDYNEAFVDAAYRRYWRMSQRPAWDTWVSTLNGGIPGSDYDALIRAFLNDERYRGRFTDTPYSRSLDANRNRLFANWAALHGQSDLCQAWQSQTCGAKGVFLTLTHRLQVSVLEDYSTTPLDHVSGMYAMLGDDWDGNHCGGDDNRIFVSMDPYLRTAMINASSRSTTWDQNGNKYWTPSNDLAGPHSPFDASNMTSYGHPRGQMHFWGSGSGAWTPVYSTGVNGVIDPNIMEIDQDYDWNHPSATECSYDTAGCDTCQSGYNQAGFSSGPGRMIYARQHPYLYGSFAGPDYEWAPTGCERQWCGGCGTCEAATSWGYKLGRPAQRCSDVPCDGTQTYVCRLDGVKKVCAPPYGWVAADPPPTCDPIAEQSCSANGGSWDPSTCSCTDSCRPDGYCSEYDYVNCYCLRN